MQVPIDSSLETGIRLQIARLHASQTLPFQALIADYVACLQHNRELEVRESFLGACSMRTPPQSSQSDDMHSCIVADSHRAGHAQQQQPMAAVSLCWQQPVEAVFHSTWCIALSLKLLHTSLLDATAAPQHAATCTHCSSIHPSILGPCPSTC